MLDGFDEAVSTTGRCFEAFAKSGAGLMMQGVYDGAFVFPEVC